MPESAGTTRITANIGPQTNDALKRFIEREGVTMTEAIRKLVGLGDLVYQAAKVDGVPVLFERDGRAERLVII